MRPNLTIAIPTFNRAEKLKNALERLIRYRENKNIEIIISDNASTDSTKMIAESFCEKFANVSYYRNDENLGFDGNFFNCFEKATGQYVWLLSDDDVLLEGAIESVLRAIEKEPVCIHLNTSMIINDKFVTYGTPRFKDLGLVLYEDKNKFVNDIGIYCTFVSSLVYNLDYVREIRDKEQYFNTNILQSHIFFEIMKNEGIYIINTFNCLAARANNTVAYDVLKTWVKSYSELLLDTAVKCGFDRNSMEKMLQVGLSTTIYEFVLYFRKTCTNEKTWDRECIWNYIEKFPNLIRRYKIAVECPVWFLKILKLELRIRKRIGYEKCKY